LNPHNRVFVTGAGIITSLGVGAHTTYAALQSGLTGMGPLKNLPSVHASELPVAEIKMSDEDLRNLADVPAGQRFSRATLLAIVAGRQAIEQSFPKAGTLPEGLISATTVGGMERTERFFAEYRSDRRKGRLRDVATHDCGDGADSISRLFGISGYISTLNTACSSSANAIGMAARLIAAGRLRSVLAGGTDALTLFTLNGFNSLMILDREHCKPFDENRNGLNLGEGAGFLMLESEEFATSRGQEVLCEITGFGNACDAFHQTASSPDGRGAWLSMQAALNSAGLLPGQISYINAHGTGTKNNDLSEGIAIERLFGTSIPPVSSTKPFTGHTLGAAGAIEAVFSVLAIQQQCVFPNLNHSRQMNELGFSPVTTFSTSMEIKHVLSNSFGFGGNNSTLIFSAV